MEDGEDELDPMGGLGIEQLNAEVYRQLQLTGLQNWDIDIAFPSCESQTAPETSNSDPMAGHRPLGAGF